MKTNRAAPTLHIANDAGLDNVRLHWSTAYPGFQLQGTPTLGGLMLQAFTKPRGIPHSSNASSIS